MAIAFRDEEFGEALKDFVGQIIATDYAEEPFGMKGAPGIKRQGKVLCIQIRTDAYSKDQYEWYPPSNVKKTKWQYFVEALNVTGAMKDISIAGKKDDERMASFAQSLLGMTFRLQEQECESLVKEKGAVKKFNIMLPVEYLGKKPIEPTAASVKQTTISEPATTSSPGGVD